MGYVTVSSRQWECTHAVTIDNRTCQTDWERKVNIFSGGARSRLSRDSSLDKNNQSAERGNQGRPGETDKRSSIVTRARASGVVAGFPKRVFVLLYNRCGDVAPASLAGVLLEWSGILSRKWIGR